MVGWAAAYAQELQRAPFLPSVLQVMGALAATAGDCLPP